MRSRKTIDKAAETYGLDNWGNGFFSIGSHGNLLVHPTRDPSLSLDLRELIDRLKTRDVSTPVLLRFPQVIESQVRQLRQSFQRAIAEYDYGGSHIAVFPMKVNQRRVVLDAYLEEGKRYNFGLEAGSKSELYAAMALPKPTQSLLVLNGFKDEEFIELAFLASRAGSRPVVVIEKLNELDHFMAQHTDYAPAPQIGIRVKLYSKGSGRWEKSGGEAAKFGLTSTEVLEVIRRLRECNCLHLLSMLHFHIGSQITDIKRIKHAVREAARVYSKIVKMNVPIQYLDVGGGLAVDYDGSRSTFASSSNYSMQEFANDIVYQIKLVVEEEAVPYPVIVTESGRILAAHHSIIVTNVQTEIETVVEAVTPLQSTEDDPPVVDELDDLNRHVNSKNFHECYHDVLELRDQLFTLFDLGLVDFEQRARGETLFWEVCEKVDRFASLCGPKYESEEFTDLRRLLGAKYLTNLSVFTMMPDHWALDQLFPILPIHRLDTPPTVNASLCDITCDSDGVVDRFIDMHNVKEVLEVHNLIPGEPYYLAVCLVGAYQEVMGNQHNLFGCPHEAIVHVDGHGEPAIEIVAGDTISDVLEWARYDPGELRELFRQQLKVACNEGRLSQHDVTMMTTTYEEKIGSYTYLDPLSGLAGETAVKVTAEKQTEGATD